MPTLTSADSELESLQARLDGLASFNRHVAHDLRGPLVSLNNASRFGQCALQRGDIEAAAHLLQLITRQSEGLTQLLGELLALSEANDARWVEAPVDLNDLARSAIEQVRQSSDDDAAADIRLHPLPPAWGAAGLLRQVFVNLVANAIKFTRGVPSPTIEIGVAPCKAQPTLYVQDNGIGFDTDAAAGLFQPFGRLHGAQYPGHGIGLSFVKRVVERHGGSVWADARAASGATFFFTLGRIG